MPADRDELRAILAEGVIVHELLAPAAVRDAEGRLELQCVRMRLGATDASGRPRPEPVPGEGELLRIDTLVTAIGQAMAGDVLADADRPAGADAPLPQPDNVFVAGDALHGAASLIEAIADGRRAAAAMLNRLGLPVAAAPAPAPRELSDAAWQDRAARLSPPIRPPQRRGVQTGDFELVGGELRAEEARAEAARCLDCSIRCDVCVSVCPDRAMLAFTARPVSWPLVRIERRGAGHRLVPDGEFAMAQDRQIVNVLDFCNACGNCNTFCPTAGDPSRDKPRVALTPASYAGAQDVHYLSRRNGETRIRHRSGGREESLTRRGSLLVYEIGSTRVRLDTESFAVCEVALGEDAPQSISLRGAAALAALLDGLAAHPLVREEG